MLKQDVAAETPGEGKKALILSPFGWQWMGAISDEAYRLMNSIRDYKGEEGGKVTYRLDPDPLADRAPGSGAPMSAGNVLFADFLFWNTYNVVLLVTHGWVKKCDSRTIQTPVPPPGRGRPGDRSGWTQYDRKWEEVWDASRDADDPNTSVNEFEYCPVVWAGRTKQADYGGYPGVEIAHYRTLYEYGDERPDEPATQHPAPSWERIGDDFPSHPGLTRDEAAWCQAEIDNGVENPTTAGGKKPCTLPRWKYKRPMILLTMPFFRHTYPKGLDNTIAFLAACFSGFNYYLLDHLTGFDRGMGNENVAAFGFFGRGRFRGDYDTAIPKMIAQLDSGYHSFKMLNEMRRVSPQLVGRAFGSPAGGAAAHGRDVVELVIPTSRSELKDGSTVRMRGAPEDGRPDRLDLRATVIGVSDRAAVDEIKLRVRAKGKGDFQTEWMDPTQPTEKVGAFQVSGPLPFRDYTDGETVDLEISAELPGGGESRWKYEDIELVGCYWRVSFSGARNGEAEGGQVMHIYDGGVELPGGIANPRLTYVIGGQKLNVAAFTLDFGDKPLQVGTTGEFLLGTGPPDDYSDLDLSLPGVASLWRNYMTGERRTFTVTILENDEKRLSGTFRGNLLNVPWRNPGGYGKPTIDHGDIRVEGEFDWQWPGCSAERR